ncbi:MAG: HD domain-containing protein [Candidatus Acidiferrum sp.]
MKKTKHNRIVANGIALSRRFEKALMYAVRIHGKQVRKRTHRPYIGHLLSVASIVIEFEGDEDMAIAALLHDAVEDQGGLPRLRDIGRKFGKKVARIVDGCTDSYATPKSSWIDRKRAYLERIPKEAADVRLVSAADKLSNVRETLQDVRAHGVEVFESFAGKKDGTLWYYQALVGKFREVESNALIEELARVVAELKRLSTRRSLERNGNQKEKRRRAE